MGLTRRDILRWLATAGAGTAAAAWAKGGAAGLLALVREARAAAEGRPEGSAHSGEGMARDAAETRQWVMVVDLARCEGCRTLDRPPQCTVACTAEHHVPFDQEWIKVYEADDHGHHYFLPTPCMQCEKAPCVDVCPVGASYHAENGIVLIDHQRCIGCRFCMAACPYAARHFIWGDPPELPQTALVKYSPEYPLPYRRGTVVKCMFCAHRAREGRLPACVEGCPMGALYFGDYETDLASNGAEVVRLSRLLQERHAYRLKEKLGTRPRAWYLPGHGEAFLGQTPGDGAGVQGGAG